MVVGDQRLAEAAEVTGERAGRRPRSVASPSRTRDGSASAAASRAGRSTRFSRRRRSPSTSRSKRLRYADACCRGEPPARDAGLPGARARSSSPRRAAEAARSPPRSVRSSARRARSPNASERVSHSSTSSVTSSPADRPDETGGRPRRLANRRTRKSDQARPVTIAYVPPMHRSALGDLLIDVDPDTHDRELEFWQQATGSHAATARRVRAPTPASRVLVRSGVHHAATGGRARAASTST